jgi:MerR family mercuric resistance operon transcriptional regulator
MKDTGKRRALKSGELARAAGVSADTLSHYEKLGLLPVPVRSEAGYRLYPPETLARVQMIRSAVRVGFTLAELAEVLKQRRAGGTPCRKVAELAAQHLEALNPEHPRPDSAKGLVRRKARNLGVSLANTQPRRTSSVSRITPETE